MGNSHSNISSVELQLWKIAATNDINKLTVEDVKNQMKECDNTLEINEEDLEKKLKEIKEEIPKLGEKRKLPRDFSNNDEVPVKRQKIEDPPIDFDIEAEDGQVKFVDQRCDEKVSLSVGMWLAIRHNISKVDQIVNEYQHQTKFKLSEEKPSKQNEAPSFEEQNKS
eukprot:gb/GECH01014399.1/.p1 GENE.gb/GECH01014399.1/~~gb/GECH01014399.1/.p1  ORF type:complete len:167 (+),score=59.13 gb/GECH01014399.1/:1-501(+)